MTAFENCTRWAEIVSYCIVLMISLLVSTGLKAQENTTQGGACSDIPDSDNDGRGDECDNCLEVPNSTLLGTCGNWQTLEIEGTCITVEDCPQEYAWVCMNYQGDWDREGVGDGRDNDEQAQQAGKDEHAQPAQHPQRAPAP